MHDPITTTEQAIASLAQTGETVIPANRTWRRRGFAFYAQRASQMLTAADLIEYATNERELHA